MSKTLFVSYTSSEKPWADWVGWVAQDIGYTVRIHHWEIGSGQSIAAWMQDALDTAHGMLALCSDDYFTKVYSQAEVEAALMKAWEKQSGFLKPVEVEKVTNWPIFLRSPKRVSLVGLGPSKARKALVEYLSDPSPPSELPFFPQSGSEETLIEAGPSFPLNNLPLSRLPLHVFARGSDLAKLIKIFSKNVNKAITAVSGMGGVGKTTLALSFAADNELGFSLRWWIPAETEATIVTSLAELAEAHPEIVAGPSELTSAKAALEWLRNARSALIVYDNAPDYASLRKYLPDSNFVSIILTTRASISVQDATTVNLDVWNTDAATNYLCSVTGNNEPEAALAISQILDGLPLALEQAGRYCESSGCSLEGYQARLTIDKAALLQRGPVWATFALAMQQAEEEHADARHLIEFLSNLAPEPIPVEILENSRAPENLRNWEKRDAAIAALKRQALVRTEIHNDLYIDNVGHKCVSLHRLVRDIALENATIDRSVEVVNTLLEAYSLDVEMHDSWPVFRILTPHVAALMERDTLPKSALSCLMALLEKDAKYLEIARGDSTGALARYEFAILVCRKFFGKNRSDLARLLASAGYALWQQWQSGRDGALPRARAYLEEALSIVDGPWSKETGLLDYVLHTLAIILRDVGTPETLDAAESHKIRSIQISKNLYGERNRSLPYKYGNLAYILKARATRTAFEKALVFEKKALEIAEEQAPSNEIVLGECYENLGHTLWTLGQKHQAERHFRLALLARRTALEPGHPHIGNIERALSDLLTDRPPHFPIHS